MTNISFDCAQQHIHYQFKREEIEYPIIHRINSVFRRATNKWKVLHTKHLYSVFCSVSNGCISYRSRQCLVFPQDDVQLWLSHVAFCKKWVCNDLIICFKYNSGSNTASSHDNNDLFFGLPSSGHQRPDQQGVLINACYPP